MPLKNYYIKLKHIAPAFFAITIIPAIILALLRLLFILLGIEIWKEVWEIFIPLLLSFIITPIWFRPKLKILVFKKQSNTKRDTYMFLPISIIIGILTCSQIYIGTATGKLKNVNHPEEIEKQKPAQYYTIKAFSISKNTNNHFINVSHGKGTHFTSYFVFPMVQDTTKLTHDISKVWYAVNFSKTIHGNGLSAAEEKKEFNRFEKEAIQKAKNYKLLPATYFRSLPSSFMTEGYITAVEKATKRPIDNSVTILEPITRPFNVRNGIMLPLTLYIFVAGTIFFLISLSWSKLSNLKLLKDRMLTKQ